MKAEQADLSLLHVENPVARADAPTRWLHCPLLLPHPPLLFCQLGFFDLLSRSQGLDRSETGWMREICFWRNLEKGKEWVVRDRLILVCHGSPPSSAVGLVRSINPTWRTPLSEASDTKRSTLLRQGLCRVACFWFIVELRGRGWCNEPSIITSYI